MASPANTAEHSVRASAITHRPRGISQPDYITRPYLDTSGRFCLEPARSSEKRRRSTLGKREFLARLSTWPVDLHRLRRIAVRHLGPVAGVRQVLADLVRDHHRPMVPAGAAEGDGQVALALAD